jgi:hypothetical protein
MASTNQKTFLAYFSLFGLIFDLENGGSTFLRNVGERLPEYTASYPEI